MLAHDAASNRKWRGTTTARIYREDLLTAHEEVPISLSQYLVSYSSFVYAGIMCIHLRIHLVSQKLLLQ